MRIENENGNSKKTIEWNISCSWTFSLDLFNVYSTILRELDDISVSMYMSYLICCLLNSSRYRSQTLSTPCFAFISLLMDAMSLIFLVPLNISKRLTLMDVASTKYIETAVGKNLRIRQRKIKEERRRY